MKKLLLFVKDVVIIFVAALILAVLIKGFVVDNRVIPTSSMAPTVEPGSRILVNRFVYRFNDVEAGDIIVFEPTPTTVIDLGLDDDLLKRVIGMPGDTVEVKEGNLYINGTVTEESYISEEMRYEYGPITVPEDCVFVLGDNRQVSKDSRNPQIGFIDEREILGKAVFLMVPGTHGGTEKAQYDRIGFGVFR